MAQYQELPVEVHGSTEAVYSWSISVTDEGIVLTGDVPYLSVKQGLMRRAGDEAIDQMAVAEGAPLGFLIDATKAIEASALLLEGTVAYSDGDWTIGGTFRTNANLAALNEVLGKKTMTGEPWLIELENSADLPAVQSLEVAAAEAGEETEIPEPAETFPASSIEVTPEISAQPVAVELADSATQGTAEQKTRDETAGALVEEAATTPTDEPLRESESAPPTEVDPVPAAEPVQPIDTCRERVESYMADRSILFGSGSARLTADSETDLAGLAEIFAICPSAPVYVEGHTDTDGRAEDNLILSLTRAEAVVDALMELGIDPARLYAVGYGASLPIATNETRAGKAQNRRIVFSFEDIAGTGEGDEE